MVESPFLTPHEVATLLKVSRSEVYRLLRSGEIPSVRLGASPAKSGRNRGVRAVRQGVEEYIERKIQEATTPRTTHHPAAPITQQIVGFRKRRA